MDAADIFLKSGICIDIFDFPIPTKQPEIQSQNQTPYQDQHQNQIQNQAQDQVQNQSQNQDQTQDQIQNQTQNHNKNRVQKENRTSTKKRKSCQKKGSSKKRKKQDYSIITPDSKLLIYNRPRLEKFAEDVLMGKDTFAKALVDTCRQLKPNLELLNYDGGSFIFTSWLSIARIFEATSNNFIEVRRLPQNKIEIVPNVITNLHIERLNLYLGYCWGHQQHPFKSYLEIRDLLEENNNENLVETIFFEQSIDDIYSDTFYLYVILSDGLVHIFRKELRDCNYQVDYSFFAEKTGRQVVSVRVLDHLCQFTNLSEIILIAATHKEILISKKSMDRHELISSNVFTNSELNIISMDFIDSVIIIVRRTGNQIKQESSEIDLGYIRTNTTWIEFALEYTLQLRCYIIKTFLVTKSGHLIIFTRKKEKKDEIYEVASLWLPKLQFIWTTIVENVNSHCTLSALDENNVIIAKTCQDFVRIKVDISDRHECSTCKLFFPSSQILDLHVTLKHVSAFKHMKCDQDKDIHDAHVSAFKRLPQKKEKTM